MLYADHPLTRVQVVIPQTVAVQAIATGPYMSLSLQTQTAAVQIDVQHPKANPENWSLTRLERKS